MDLADRVSCMFHQSSPEPLGTEGGSGGPVDEELCGGRHRMKGGNLVVRAENFGMASLVCFDHF
jgi:hypothetical protein